MIKLIKKLSEAHGVPGSEDEVSAIIKAELEDYCEVKHDIMGNLIAKKNGGKKKIMVAAHMDEIGLMIRHIDEKGFIKFLTLGGFFDQTILNQSAVVHTKKGRLPGVVGSKPPHLMEEKEKDKPIKSKDMFIDVGAGDGKAVKKLGVSVGDHITFQVPFRELKNGLITGKAFDNRLGCAVMVEVMKNIESKHTVYAVGTVQEEVGLKGARTSAYAIDPDIAIALDVAPTHPNVRDSIIRTAEKRKLPYQLEVGEGGTTDATAIQLTKGGVLSGVVSVPTRYIHTPVEVASLLDIQNTVKLVTNYLEDL
jgi:endoglucanase